ncbi:carboxypeptidase-like regulatory domain-containing protein [Microtetraspora niveoalba]|uniref:carboxypeptidase-like regulatory domain-containing protein n=1 Tax=Microtetraspora niveoalba TaxID=46175 RepID=UPI0008357DC5|nr:carboxypeptidase-like regulatory domain-containing protein [Microtetraspora niveoalba]
MGRLLAAGVLLMTLGGCGMVAVPTDDDGRGASRNGDASARRTDDHATGRRAGSGEIEPGVLKGRVVDAEGGPVAGALIAADNQMVYNSNLIVPTDADGFYRVETPGSFTFHATGTVTRRLDGREYVMDLEPDDDNPYAGPEGAIRNFTWRLAGTKPGDRGHYGGAVLFYLNAADPGNPEVFLEDEKVTLTLTPQGPLIDGSTGRTITARAERTPDGSGLPSVPIGRYRITASYEDRQLRVRSRGDEEYAREVVADFTSVMTGIYRIELELSL